MLIVEELAYFRAPQENTRTYSRCGIYLDTHSVLVFLHVLMGLFALRGGCVVYIWAYRIFSRLFGMNRGSGHLFHLRTVILFYCKTKWRLKNEWLAFYLVRFQYYNGFSHNIYIYYASSRSFGLSNMSACACDADHCLTPAT